MDTLLGVVQRFQNYCFNSKKRSIPKETNLLRVGAIIFVSE